VPINSTEGEADRQITDFATRLVPELSRFVPN